MLDVDGDGKIEYEEFMETVKASMAAEKSGGSAPGGMSADSRVAMDKLAEKLLTNAVREESGRGGNGWWVGGREGRRCVGGMSADSRVAIDKLAEKLQTNAVSEDSGVKWGAGRGNTREIPGRSCAEGGGPRSKRKWRVRAGRAESENTSG